MTRYVVPAFQKRNQVPLHKLGKHLKRFRVVKFGFARQVIWQGKICTLTSRNASSWVCSVDFDGRREMSISSLKTIVVHYSVTLLMMATNLQKGGRVHRVPCTKTQEKLQELFQSVCVLSCKYKHFATSAIEKTRWFTFPSRCWWMRTRDMSAGLRQSMISLVLNYALICFISPINACIWTIFSHKLVI